MDGQTLDSSSSSSTSSSISPPPPPEDAWVEIYRKLLPQWLAISSTSQEGIPIEISRVNQFDAARLDIEMSAMLKEQLIKVFSLTKPGMLFQYEPELDAFLEFLIWRFSIWVDKPTPGNALMNLRYRDERAFESRSKVRTGLEGPGLTVSQKIWYCIATVGGQYVWARLQSFSAFRRWGDTEQRSLGRRSWFLLQRIEAIYKATSFVNLLIFLLTGRYRSLIERGLKARLVYESPHMNRSVSFEYMNRQLVWNEFSEMLLLLLPLLNSSPVKNFLRPFSKDKSSSSERDEALCPICQTTPTTPFLAIPCQHRTLYANMILLIGTATTVYELAALLLRPFGALGATNLLLLCSGMGLLSAKLLRMSNYYSRLMKYQRLPQLEYCVKNTRSWHRSKVHLIE